ncbi:putative hemolysin [Alkalibacterium subtropicum]|uniref:Putative hemolysin n=1 Tax=Alkalibacterium subtropicum TaxID=753702 RepID=A0A1I1HER7_9LACT|nr:hemolysin family protein [Alkalibacterium subtropicum]SFC22649.1 putative hemolysin [Alkalibacterium subtropicum]
MAIAIITLIILILLNGFFAASELAFVNLNDNKVKRMADNGDKKAQKLYDLISRPSLFLSTIQIGITLAGFLSSAFAADFFADPMAQALYDLGVPMSLSALNSISVVVITVVLSYFTLVFGELVPKQLAMQKAEAIANIAVGPVSLLAKVSAPIVKFLSFSIKIIFKLFGADPNAENEEATEEDIRMLVDLGRERGTIHPVERVMIENIFEFNDTTASNILTHRTDMIGLSADSDLNTVLETVNKYQYTRFPVYENNIDNIIGVLHVKDLFMYMKKDNGSTFILKEAMRAPHFVQDSQTIDKLFAKMRQENTHLAIVLDEFGGTQGMITIEDVIEEIVGEITSESMEPNIYDEEITKLSPKQYRVIGTYRLRDLEHTLNVSFPTDEFDTVRGFLINELGHVPAKDDHAVVEFKHLTFEIEGMDENRIETVLITVNEQMDDNSKETSGQTT